LTERADTVMIMSAVASDRAEIDVARAWARALEAADGNTLVGLSDDGIELVSRRGVVRGSQALRDLAQRQTYGAAVNFRPRAWFQRGHTVVVAVDHPLRFVDTGEVSDAMPEGAAAFVVRQGRVARFTPCPDLASALDATGLTDADAIFAVRDVLVRPRYAAAPGRLATVCRARPRQLG
jgi:hypothetical protein